MRKNSNGLPTIREQHKIFEKMESQSKSRNRKRLLIIGSSLIVLAVVIFVVVKMIAAAIAADSSQIPGAIPSSADTVVVAPSSSDWWSDVTNMAPLTFNIHDLDPYSAGLNIEYLGYSRSVDNSSREVSRTGPIRSVYIESPTDEDAAKIESWLEESKGNEGRGVHREGSIVQVTYNWITQFEKPNEAVTSRSDFSLDRDKKKAFMWVNFNNQVDSLAGADNPHKELVSEYFAKSFAFKDQTTWSGGSFDGVSWEGKFVAGGMDIDQFEPEAVRNKLVGTRKEIASVDGGSSRIYENSLYSLIVNSGFQQNKDSVRNGGVEVPEVAPAVKDEALRAVIQPSQWNVAVNGFSAQDEGVNRIAFSIAKNKMNMVFRYGANAMVSEMPEFATITPDVTIVPIPGRE
jgi:hypothetical protein